MKLRSYSSEGIILSRKNYGEADRILIVLSKNFGKISLLAKGIRKIKSKKRGHLEIFSYIRFSATKGKGLDLIIEAETLNAYKDIREKLEKVTLAYYFAEVAKKLSQEEEKNESFFTLIVSYFDQLRTQSLHYKDFRHKFIEESLILLGFWPRGRNISDPDKVLEEVTEKKMASAASSLTSRVSQA